MGVRLAGWQYHGGACNRFVLAATAGVYSFTGLAQVLIIGTDVPDLHQGILAQALAALDDHQVTLRNRMASVDSLFESLLCCTSSEVL